LGKLRGNFQFLFARVLRLGRSLAFVCLLLTAAPLPVLAEGGKCTNAQLDIYLRDAIQSDPELQFIAGLCPSKESPEKSIGCLANGLFTFQKQINQFRASKVYQALIYGRRPKMLLPPKEGDFVCNILKQDKSETEVRKYVKNEEGKQKKKVFTIVAKPDPSDKDQTIWVAQECKVNLDYDYSVRAPNGDLDYFKWVTIDARRPSNLKAGESHPILPEIENGAIKTYSSFGKATQACPSASTKGSSGEADDDRFYNEIKSRWSQCDHQLNVISSKIASVDGRLKTFLSVPECPLPDAKPAAPKPKPQPQPQPKKEAPKGAGSAADPKKAPETQQTQQASVEITGTGTGTATGAQDTKKGDKDSKFKGNGAETGSLNEGNMQGQGDQGEGVGGGNGTAPDKLGDKKGKGQGDQDGKEGGKEGGKDPKKFNPLIKKVKEGGAPVGTPGKPKGIKGGTGTEEVDDPNKLKNGSEYGDVNGSTLGSCDKTDPNCKIGDPTSGGSSLKPPVEPEKDAWEKEECSKYGIPAFSCEESSKIFGKRDSKKMSCGDYATSLGTGATEIVNRNLGQLIDSDYQLTKSYYYDELIEAYADQQVDALLQQLFMSDPDDATLSRATEALSSMVGKCSIPKGPKVAQGEFALAEKKVRAKVAALQNASDAAKNAQGQDQDLMDDYATAMIYASACQGTIAGRLNSLAWNWHDPNQKSKPVMDERGLKGLDTWQEKNGEGFAAKVAKRAGYAWSSTYGKVWELSVLQLPFVRQALYEVHPPPGAAKLQQANCSLFNEALDPTAQISLGNGLIDVGSGFKDAKMSRKLYCDTALDQFGRYAAQEGEINRFIPVLRAKEGGKQVSDILSSKMDASIAQAAKDYRVGDGQHKGSCVADLAARGLVPSDALKKQAKHLAMKHNLDAILKDVGPKVDRCCGTPSDRDSCGRALANTPGFLGNYYSCKKSSQEAGGGKYLDDKVCGDRRWSMFLGCCLAKQHEEIEAVKGATSEVIQAAMDAMMIHGAVAGMSKGALSLMTGAAKKEGALLAGAGLAAETGVAAEVAALRGTVGKIAAGENAVANGVGGFAKSAAGESVNMAKFTVGQEFLTGDSGDQKHKAVQTLVACRSGTSSYSKEECTAAQKTLHELDKSLETKILHAAGDGLLMAVGNVGQHGLIKAGGEHASKQSGFDVAKSALKEKAKAAYDKLFKGKEKAEAEEGVNPYSYKAEAPAPLTDVKKEGSEKVEAPIDLNNPKTKSISADSALGIMAPEVRPEAKAAAKSVVDQAKPSHPTVAADMKQAVGERMEAKLREAGITDEAWSKMSPKEQKKALTQASDAATAEMLAKVAPELPLSTIKKMPLADRMALIEQKVSQKMAKDLQLALPGLDAKTIAKLSYEDKKLLLTQVEQGRHVPEDVAQLFANAVDRLVAEGRIEEAHALADLYSKGFTPGQIEAIRKAHEVGVNGDGQYTLGEIKQKYTHLTGDVSDGKRQAGQFPPDKAKLLLDTGVAGVEKRLVKGSEPLFYPNMEPKPYSESVVTANGKTLDGKVVEVKISTEDIQEKMGHDAYKKASAAKRQEVADAIATERLSKPSVVSAGAPIATPLVDFAQTSKYMGTGDPALQTKIHQEVNERIRGLIGDAEWNKKSPIVREKVIEKTVAVVKQEMALPAEKTKPAPAPVPEKKLPPPPPEQAFPLLKPTEPQPVYKPLDGTSFAPKAAKGQTVYEKTLSSGEIVHVSPEASQPGKYRISTKTPDGKKTLKSRLIEAENIADAVRHAQSGDPGKVAKKLPPPPPGYKPAGPLEAPQAAEAIPLTQGPIPLTQAKPKGPLPPMPQPPLEPFSLGKPKSAAPEAPQTHGAAAFYPDQAPVGQYVPPNRKQVTVPELAVSDPQVGDVYSIPGAKGKGTEFRVLGMDADNVLCDHPVKLLVNGKTVQLSVLPKSAFQGGKFKLEKMGPGSEARVKKYAEIADHLNNKVELARWHRENEARGSAAFRLTDGDRAAMIFTDPRPGDTFSVSIAGRMERQRVVKVSQDKVVLERLDAPAGQTTQVTIEKKKFGPSTGLKFLEPENAAIRIREMEYAAALESHLKTQYNGALTTLHEGVNAVYSPSHKALAEAGKALLERYGVQSDLVFVPSQDPRSPLLGRYQIHVKGGQTSNHWAAKWMNDSPVVKKVVFDTKHALTGGAEAPLGPGIMSGDWGSLPSAAPSSAAIHEIGHLASFRKGGAKGEVPPSVWVPSPEHWSNGPDHGVGGVLKIYKGQFVIDEVHQYAKTAKTTIARVEKEIRIIDKTLSDKEMTLTVPEVVELRQRIEFLKRELDSTKAFTEVSAEFAKESIRAIDSALWDQGAIGYRQAFDSTHPYVLSFVTTDPATGAPVRKTITVEEQAYKKFQKYPDNWDALGEYANHHNLTRDQARTIITAANIKEVLKANREAVAKTLSEIQGTQTKKVPLKDSPGHIEVQGKSIFGLVPEINGKLDALQAKAQAYKPSAELKAYVALEPPKPKGPKLDLSKAMFGSQFARELPPEVARKFGSPIIEPGELNEFVEPAKLVGPDKWVAKSKADGKTLEATEIEIKYWRLEQPDLAPLTMMGREKYWSELHPVDKAEYANRYIDSRERAGGQAVVKRPPMALMGTEMNFGQKAAAPAPVPLISSKEFLPLPAAQLPNGVIINTGTTAKYISAVTPEGNRVPMRVHEIIEYPGKGVIIAVEGGGHRIQWIFGDSINKVSRAKDNGKAFDPKNKLPLVEKSGQVGARLVRGIDWLYGEGQVELAHELEQAMVKGMEPTWVRAIEEGHVKPGPPGNPDGTYTQAQIAEKVRILKEAGVPDKLRAALIKGYVCGDTLPALASEAPASKGPVTVREGEMPPLGEVKGYSDRPTVKPSKSDPPPLPASLRKKADLPPKKMDNSPNVYFMAQEPKNPKAYAFEPGGRDVAPVGKEIEIARDTDVQKSIELLIDDWDLKESAPNLAKQLYADISKKGSMSALKAPKVPTVDGKPVIPARTPSGELLMLAPDTPVEVRTPSGIKTIPAEKAIWVKNKNGSWEPFAAADAPLHAGGDAIPRSLQETEARILMTAPDERLIVKIGKETYNAKVSGYDAASGIVRLETSDGVRVAHIVELQIKGVAPQGKAMASSLDPSKPLASDPERFAKIKARLEDGKGPYGVNVMMVPASGAGSIGSKVRYLPSERTLLVSEGATFGAVFDGARRAQQWEVFYQKKAHAGTGNLTTFGMTLYEGKFGEGTKIKDLGEALALEVNELDASRLELERAKRFGRSGEIESIESRMDHTRSKLIKIDAELKGELQSPKLWKEFHRELELVMASGAPNMGSKLAPHANRAVPPGAAKGESVPPKTASPSTLAESSENEVKGKGSAVDPDVRALYDSVRKKNFLAAPKVPTDLAVPSSEAPTLPKPARESQPAAQLAPAPVPATVPAGKPLKFKAEDAKHLIQISEGKAGLGNTVGHAKDHVPGVEISPYHLAVLRHQKDITSVYRRERQAHEDLASALNIASQDIAKIAPGEPFHFTVRLKKQRKGINATYLATLKEDVKQANKLGKPLGTLPVEIERNQNGVKQRFTVNYELSDVRFDLIQVTLHRLPDGTLHLDQFTPDVLEKKVSEHHYEIP